jgi:alkanesulfonate monooxygenase SsuD/methylene tetrahydromethanopterin reductase-like flavin-dependent oxidoreductase (luciferase family)
MLKYSVVGSPSTVRKGLEEFVAITKVDELMIVTSIHDLEARIRSYELLAETWATSS